jgi:hypothetical protein
MANLGTKTHSSGGHSFGRSKTPHQLKWGIPEVDLFRALDNGLPH